MNIFCQKILFTFSQAIAIIIIGAPGGLASSEKKEIKCLQRDSQALLKFKTGLIDDEGNLSSWENGTDCCQWKGIHCDNRVNQVVALDLAGLSLSGGKTINPSLLELDGLYHLDLSFNAFNESYILELIGSLGRLQYLNLSYCSFGGIIPHSFRNLSLLQYLDLSSNMDLQSDLGWLSGLQSVEFLDLSYVNLTEANTWVQVVTKLPKVKEIHLEWCSLQSALPTSSIRHWDLNISSSMSYIDLSGNDIANWWFLDALKNFSRLSHLDLYINELEGSIPYFLWNFTHLSYLDLSYNHKINGSISKALGNLVSLYHLDLSGNQLEGSIPMALGNLVSLYHLALSGNQLEGSIPMTLGNLVSLYHLDLSGNQLEGSIPMALGNLVSLYHLDLTGNQLEGSILRALENLMSLSYLDLSNNQLQLIEFPDQLSLSSLVYLDFSRNKLQGELTHLIMQLWNSTLLEHIYLSENVFFGSLPNMSRFQCLKDLSLHDNNLNGVIADESFRLPSLESLDLSNNEFMGRIPNLLGCPSLTFLYLNDNMFNGTLTEIIGSLSNLQELNLRSNQLEGLVTEAHLFNLSNLQTLDMSFNSNLTVRISSLWNPPFQLENLVLTQCRLGQHFPGWIKSQRDVLFLDISNAAILDTIPIWFWNMSIYTLNMSYNQIYGTLPDLSSVGIPFMDLSSNQFSGELPPLPLSGGEMYLSKNRFSGTIINLCNTTFTYILDVSDNLLSGPISPDCFTNLSSLYYLNLGNNNLSGNIRGWDSKCNLLSLHLRNNSFSGYIPKSLGRCRELIALDLQENKFYGTIPGWLGESMPSLVVLSFKSNKLHGSLPPNLCHLQKLQVLDISMNYISDAIPNCVSNFTALISETGSNLDSNGLVNLTKVEFMERFNDTSTLLWKGQIAEYSSTLRLLKAIDFSSNNFSGEIPHEITSLVGLVGLNLSRNNLIGSIPRDIGQLKFLDVLDLSYNSLSGNIPPTLSQMSELGTLDLSFNNLSGNIPQDNPLDTFGAASFIGNAGLCGPPLVSKPCPEDVEMPKKPKFVDGSDKIGLENMFKTKEFYISMVLGFIIFFWGVFGTLLLSLVPRLAKRRLLAKSVGERS